MLMGSGSLEEEVEDEGKQQSSVALILLVLYIGRDAGRRIQKQKSS